MPDRRQVNHHELSSSLPLRVLLVEDDGITLEFFSRLLTDAGATVSEAISVREATTILDTEPPFDLLLTDFVLLDGTGLEVARAARGRVKRIVLVSGELALVPLEEARAAGVEKFVPKFEVTGRRVRALLEELFG